MELNKAEYTVLAQVKIRLKQFHIDTVTMMMKLHLMW